MSRFLYKTLLEKCVWNVEFLRTWSSWCWWRFGRTLRYSNNISSERAGRARIRVLLSAPIDSKIACKVRCFDRISYIFFYRLRRKTHHFGIFNISQFYASVNFIISKAAVLVLNIGLIENIIEVVNVLFIANSKSKLDVKNPL